MFDNITYRNVHTLITMAGNFEEDLETQPFSKTLQYFHNDINFYIETYEFILVLT